MWQEAQKAPTSSPAPATPPTIPEGYVKAYDAMLALVAAQTAIQNPVAPTAI
jgi:3-oxoacyl-ACP reductase-like protein